MGQNSGRPPESGIEKTNQHQQHQPAPAVHFLVSLLSLSLVLSAWRKRNPAADSEHDEDDE